MSRKKKKKKVCMGSRKIEKEMHEIGLREAAVLSTVPGDSWHHLCFASSLLKLFLAMGKRDSYFLPFTSKAVLESDQAYARAENHMGCISETDFSQDAAPSKASCCRPLGGVLRDLKDEKKSWSQWYSCLVLLKGSIKGRE